MSKRRPISKRVRFEVLQRDGFACVYCGARAPAATLHVDHAIAVANGGTDEIGNLVTACEPCNLGKGALRMGRKVPYQRAAAIAAATFQRAAERFGAQAARWDAFDLIYNLCVGHEQPDAVFDIVIAAPSWDAARLALNHLIARTTADEAPDE